MGSRALAQIQPVQVRAGHVAAGGVARRVSNREKAAIIVRLLLSQGAQLPLASLPEALQATLAQQIGQMRLVDRATLDEVVAEFLQQLEGVGLSFPGGIEGALSMMDGHISIQAASRLRRAAGMRSDADPWERLQAMDSDTLLPILEAESVEVAAVTLSKLPVPRAAEMLGRMPGQRARRVALAMAQTGNVDPETVRRIGQALVAQVDSQPQRAFDKGPVERVGAILNISPSATRDDVLAGLDEADAAFAEKVRKAIFTFVHLPRRLHARDVPKIARAVDQPTLITALAGARGTPDREVAAEFILANMSQRLAQSLREEMEARGKVKDKDAEEAMNAIITAIRQLESAGEMVLIEEDEEE
jgi:flagellar motor switch protein FliG